VKGPHIKTRARVAVYALAYIRKQRNTSYHNKQKVCEQMCAMKGHLPVLDFFYLLVLLTQYFGICCFFLQYAKNSKTEPNVLGQLE